MAKKDLKDQPTTIIGWFRKTFKTDAFRLSSMPMNPQTGPNNYPSTYPFNVMRMPPNPDWRTGDDTESQGNPDLDQGRPVPIIIHQDRLGSSGTISFTGYPSEEYLATLRGKHKATVYDQMRRSDPQLKMCLNAVKNPIRAANWEIEPATQNDKEEQKIADFVKYVLFEKMNTPFTKFVSEALTACDYGHSVFEITNKVYKNDPIYGDFIGISDLGWRSPKTIERWNLDPQTDKLESILQLAYGDTSRFITIPGQFLVVFSIDREGSNYEGISMMRPCYGAWFRKDLYLKLNAIGIEKFAIPTPIAEIPEGKQNSDQYNQLINVLQNYVEHQSSYLTYPQGWKVDLKTNVYDPSKVEQSVQAEDQRIVKAFMANFLELGMGSSSGNRALGDSLKAFFLGGIEYVAKEFCEEVNLTLIPLIVKQNFGERAKYPKIKATGISDQAGQELATLLKDLALSQYITPDDDLEKHLRKRLGLPEMSLEGQRPVKAQGALGQSDQPANPEFNVDTNKVNMKKNSLAEKIRMAEAYRKMISEREDI